MDNLQIFKNDLFGEVRVNKDSRCGEVLFCGNDVAKALGYAKPANAVTKYCKGVTVLMTLQEEYRELNLLQREMFIDLL